MRSKIKIPKGADLLQKEAQDIDAIVQELSDLYTNAITLETNARTALEKENKESCNITKDRIQSL